jgi:hypothetical protein
MARHGVEGTLLSALQELGRVFGEKRVMNAAGTVLQTAAQTKAAMDDNVSTVLGFAGLPSRGDLDALRRQMDVMQATLANLSRKLDRLIETTQAQADGQGHTGDTGKPRRRRPTAK